MSGAGLGGAHDLALFSGGDACTSRSMLTVVAAVLVLVIGMVLCAVLSIASCSDAHSQPPVEVESVRTAGSS